MTPEGRTNRDGFLSVYVTLGDTPGGEFFDGSAFAPDIEVRLKTGQYMPVKGQLEMGQLRLAEYATVHGKLTIEKQESSRALPKTSIALRGTFDAQLPEDEDGGYAWLTSRTSPPSTALVATIGDRTENVATRVNRAGKVEIVRGKNACASTDVIMSWTPAVQASIPTSATFETTRPLALLHGWTTPTDATGFRGSLFVTSDFFDHKIRTQPQPQALAALQPSLPDDYLLAGPYDAVKCR